MTRGPLFPATASLTPVEAIARLLVVALLPELEAAMLGGFTYRETMENARRVCGEAWRAQDGPLVAARAREILEAVGPAAILTPYGREVFLREYPLSAMPIGVPRPINDNASPPPEGIRRRWARILANLFRVPPASG